MRKKSLYTTLVRQADGSWTRDEMPTMLGEARRNQRINRILGGIQSQIVPANEEERARWEEEYGEATP